ncbi:MAG: heme-binding protein [Candidatus Hydrogenedentota bacterium]
MQSTYRVFVGALCLLVAFGLTLSSDTVVAKTKFEGNTVTLEAADRVIDAAIKKSGELGVLMNITVLDAGGNLKAFARMDGAFLGSIDVSAGKAKTSVLFNAPSGVIGSMAQPGGDLYGIERSNGGLITFGGGFPLHNAKGELIGSIGVSGSSVANDELVSQAGVDAL